jgi:hypothetical protein
MAVLTRKTLDAMSCQAPECSHAEDPELFIHGACHPDEPPWACYDRTTGAMAFHCSVCGNFVAAVAVASGEGDVRQPN